MQQIELVEEEPGNKAVHLCKIFTFCFEKSVCSEASHSKPCVRVFSVIHSFGIATAFCISLRASATSAGFDVLRVISEAPATCLAYGT